MKKKWTFVDTFIVLLVIIAGVALIKVFGTSEKNSGPEKTIEAVVLLSREEPEVAETIKVGDEVTVNLAEKDTGKVDDVKIEDARTMVYNAIDGKYVIEPVEGKVDIYATVALEVSETDYAFMCGGTNIKVGERLPLRGKGYALEGYIIEIVE